jgi:amidase
MRPTLLLPFLFFVVLSASAEELPDVAELGIDEIRSGYEGGDFSITEVTRAYLARIEALDRSGPRLNAVISLNPDALDNAARLDEELAAGDSRGPLHGMPVLLKDNIDVAGLPTTAGSKILDGSLPSGDAFLVQRLREAGVVILGKNNLSEWANFHSSFSSSGWSRLGGQTHNPHDTSRNPCGSSSGSAVATAAGLAAFTIGTETDGSIVCPAQANGIVGLKPTVGLVSRTGIIPIAHSMDSPGPMTRSVTDAAIVLGVLAASDADDEATGQADEHRQRDYTRHLDAGALEGRRIGLYTKPMGAHYRVDALTHAAVKAIEEAGAEIVEIERIAENDVGALAFEVLLHEFRAGLDAYFERLGDAAPVADFDALIEAIRDDPGETARFDRALMFMAAQRGGLDGELYRNALAAVHQEIRDNGIDRVMDKHELDALIAPSGSPAWKTDLTLGDNLSISSSTPAARAGYPIITVPMGFIDGLPVGLSFFGRAWSEPELLALAYAYEQATGHFRAPSLSIQ